MFVIQAPVQLREEKENWYSELSGGQRSKVELIRTLFVRPACPRVLNKLNGNSFPVQLGPEKNNDVEISISLHIFCDFSVPLGFFFF